MKVLHFIPNLNAVSASCMLRYKVTLLEHMSRRVEVHLLTSEKADVQLGRTVIHTYSPIRLLTRKGKKRLNKMLSSINPDVVHIHACWNPSAYRLFRICERNNIQTVLTFDRKLEKWHLTYHYWPHKLLKILRYQRYMFSRADAMHAVNAQECADISRLSWFPWLNRKRNVNDRIAMINIFTLVNGMTVSDMCDSLLSLYQKVVDTSPFFRMTDDERHAEDLLLVAGASMDNALIPVTEDDIAKMCELDGNSWRRIFIHAHDENVLNYVEVGLRRLGMSVETLDVEEIERFRLNDDDIAKTDKAERNPKIRKLKSDESMPALEHDICQAIVTTTLKVKRLQVTRADFVDLYQKIRFNDYDEDLVVSKLKALSMDKKSARLLQILKERYLLTDGFMYAEPLDDKGTARLRQKLFKSRIQ